MNKTMYLGIAGGILLVALAFFIPAQEGSLWPSLIAGGVASLAYLIALSVYGIRKIESSGKRKLVTAAMVLLVIFSISSASISYENTKRQMALLPQIRTTIETGMVETYIKEYLLKTMRAYYTEDKFGENAGLDEIFRARFDSLITEDGLLLYDGKDTYSKEDETKMQIFVHTTKTDSIVLVAESGYMDGLRPEFKNYSGAKGMYQAKGILTKEGIDYERTN
ncbi:MAG: hypothetical protein ACNS64_06660 [Candidatus Halalkalibacterium sp. M3_1C_030]